MSVKRSFNAIAQLRFDVPHLKSIESSIRSDFDDLVNAIITGEGKSYVVRGFYLNMIGAMNSSANSLQMVVGNSSILHGKSAQAGTFFTVPTGTPNETLNSTINTKINGSFTAGSINYVGVEFTRAVDNATTSQVYIWNPTTQTETTKTLPLAEVLNYQIVITTSNFASNILPIAIVGTDASNNVTSVEDRRPMLFRLGQAGSTTPNPNYQYPWTAGRAENFWKTTTATSPFEGGDKQIGSLKDWADAVMTSIQEIKGTPFWYSVNTGGGLLKIRNDMANTVITGSGNIIHSNTVAGRLNWTDNIFLNLLGSRLTYKITSNVATTDITLANDQVAYIQLERGKPIIPNLVLTQGSATVTAATNVNWTADVLAGDFIKVASSLDSAYYEILSVDTLQQVTLKTNYLETSTGSTGVQCQYAWGTYQTNAAPSTNRHIKVVARKDMPSTEDIYWLFHRQDNASGTALVYVKFGAGSQMSQGETRSVVNNMTIEVLQYMGTPSEVATNPDYAAVTVSAGSLALQDYNTTTGESLTARLAKLTAMFADVKQDFNIAFNSGAVTWNGTNISITGASLSVPGTTVGAAAVSINTYASAALAQDSCLYVDISRSAGTALTLASSTIAALTPSQQRLVVARRIGADIWLR